MVSVDEWLSTTRGKVARPWVPAPVTFGSCRDLTKFNVAMHDLSESFECVCPIVNSCAFYHGGYDGIGFSATAHRNLIVSAVVEINGAAADPIGKFYFCHYASPPPRETEAKSGR